MKTCTNTCGKFKTKSTMHVHTQGLFQGGGGGGEGAFSPLEIGLPPLGIDLS